MPFFHAENGHMMPNRQLNEYRKAMEGYRAVSAPVLKNDPKDNEVLTDGFYLRTNEKTEK